MVKKCTEKKTGKQMAVKIFGCDDEEKLKAGEHEFEIQKKLKHKNIIEVFELYKDELRNTIYTVMELFDGC